MNPLRTFASAIRRLAGSRTSGLVEMNHSIQLSALPLEERLVPSGTEYRSIDGTGNNLVNTTWGSAGTAFLRMAAAQYGDGINMPAGSSRPSARLISDTVSDEGSTVDLDERMLSAMIYAWGQFIDHDLDLTPTGTAETFNIPVPTGDESFDPNSTGTQVIPMTRSIVAAGTGTSTSNPRQQVNAITAWLDGSMIYGSDSATAKSLRTLIGGKLKLTANGLLPVDSSGNFLAGDTRVNENPELTSLQTLFAREHNRQAARIAAANPKLSDEEIYQKARAWVIAEIEAITFNEWLPSLLGSNALPAYHGYNPNLNPGITTEFATAAFRLGHSMLGDDIEFLDNNGNPIRDSVELADAFFNPQLIKDNGIDPLLKYLASDPSSKIDTQVVDSVRNFLFGEPGAGGLDLASLNIQRGRDHGIADYNTTRAAYGLPKVTSFEQITNDADLAAKLKTLYGSVDNIDLWVGVLAEKHVSNGSVGQTAKTIIAEQFNRLRAADRFWYQRTFSGSDLAQLENTTLAGIIRQNTKLTSIQQNPFFFRADMSGTIFNDANRDGRMNPSERGLGGRTVQLINVLTNEVVDSAVTDSSGQYHFGVADGLRTGRYLVRVSLNSGEMQTTTTSVIVITQGDQIRNRIDIGITHALPPRPVPPPHHGTQDMLFLAPTLMGVDLNADPITGIKRNSV